MDQAVARLSPLLDRLVNYERDRPNQALWDLAVTSALLSRAGAATPRRPAVQVGGSKGKGSTCTMLAALANRAGMSVGVYTSPHVTTLLERIVVDGSTVPIDDLERILRQVLATPGERAPTFFEAMTVAAAQWFAERRVDLAVYEVGLGGRLHATTASPVDLSILTTIELEHTEILGDTVAAIAREKAHIIRPGGIALTTATGEALPQLQARADEVGAKLLVADRDFGAVRVRDRGDLLTGNLWLPDRLVPFELRGGAMFDLSALAVAACGLETLRPGVLGKELAMTRPQAPCRFEVLPQPDGGAVVLDGAHTERSMAAVAEELRRRWPGRKFAVLFGSAAGKRWRESLSCLLPLVDNLKVTAVSGTSSEDPSLIAEHCHARGIAAERVDDVEAGLAALARCGGIRVVVGSFYLVGEARRLLVSAAANLA